MIDIHTETDGSLVSVTPSGKITEVDIDALRTAINNAINENDLVPALLFRAKSFPGWESFAAMLSHLKLVHDRQNLVPRVAMVSDGVLLGIAPSITGLFLKAEVRHFSDDDLAHAMEWAKNGAPDDLALEILDGYPNDVVAMKMHGRLTSRDYEELLVPLVEEKLLRHDKLKVLLVIDNTFEGATAGAMWDDAKLGFASFTKYRKMAVVTDINWLRKSTQVFGVLMPGEIRAYPLHQRSLADDWIRT